MNSFLFPTRLLLVYLLLSLPAPVLLAQSPRKLESVTLGLSAKHVLNLPIYLAQRHGIFESEGFDYKPITTKTNTAIAALVSGDLDYITAFNSGLSAALGGAPLVATYISTDKSLLYLITRPDIKDAKALRGGIIGHGGTRGSHYHATVAMVKYLGLDADKDVQLISTIDVTQGMTALLSGTVAGATLSPPYDSIAVRKGYNRLVVGPDILPRFAENGLVVRRAKLRDNPDQVRRFLRALIRGLQYAIDRPNEAVALIQKEWNLDRETAQTAYDAAIPTYNLRGETSDELDRCRDQARPAGRQNSIQLRAQGFRRLDASARYSTRTETVTQRRSRR